MIETMSWIEWLKQLRPAKSESSFQQTDKEGREMKKLILGKIRDTKEMQLICEEPGNRNDCYGTYKKLYMDPRDEKFFVEFGHWSSGLGPDTLTYEPHPLMWIEENMTSLSDEEAETIEKLLKP